ncbi:MAG: amylo-alpha-1,6-glucosidase [Betaproteobacteria bacterium]
MKPNDAMRGGTVVVPGVVSLAASSRRTLKHDATFAMFDEYGDVVGVERDPAGVFHRDTRHLSLLRFTLEGHRPLVLSSTVQLDNMMLDVDLTNPDFFRDDKLLLAKDTFHVSRAKFLWQACAYELFVVTSYSAERRRLRFALDFDADFADLFEIRGFVRRRRGAIAARVVGGTEVEFSYASLDGVPRSTRVCFGRAPTLLEPQRAEFDLDIESRARVARAVTVHCVQGAPPPAERRFFAVRRAARRTFAAARADAPAMETSNAAFNSVLQRSGSDLAMLVNETPHGPYPSAGVPWFSTAFGRDGILTAIELLAVAPDVSRGVLRFLAAHQAEREDPDADMEPGKILHEMRDCELARLGEVPFGRYYGSVDSTPLFVVLAGMYWARTQDVETIDAIWPNVLRALAWIERYGDRDGDGFVEYDRRRETGLRNQGWKDSDDSVFHADGRLAPLPIALCEVQGYVHLAYRAASLLARDRGDASLAGELGARATALHVRFEKAFWCEALGTYALALDGEKQPCRVRSSNAGQLLFCGIAAPERGARLARQLMGADFFTGWGLRTLSSREKRYNPTSYHNGSVWPHDNALIALGMARYGYQQAAQRVTDALFDAATHMHLRRLPELFCGFDRKRGKAPTLYPVACAPQAWAAVAPYALIQACLGLEIDGRTSRVALHRPCLPWALEWLTIRRLQVGSGRIELMLRRQGDSVAVNLLSREGAADVEVML